MPSVSGVIKSIEKRGVFRTAGIYIALVWLLLQVADVVFPAFAIPDEAARYIVIGAIVGFPFVMLFSWFFEITDQGVQLEKNVDRSGAERVTVIGSTNFIIFLTVALSISVFINIYTNTASDADTDAGQQQSTPSRLTSVLIADFDNQTQDPLFDGTLEEVLTIGMEGASFVNSYGRDKAIRVADSIQPAVGLKVDRAQLVAVREGVDLVLVGRIVPEGKSYRLALNATEPATGNVVASAEVEAQNKLDVLQAVGSLAQNLREALGDVAASEQQETLTATSLEAVKLYTQAQQLARKGQHTDAVILYQQAVDQDPEFGRAYSGWALSEFQLGHTQSAEELWQQALTYLPAMTDREKFRTLGLYYMRVSGNFRKAVENYQQLVAQFPGDMAAASNLAVAHFMLREFNEAVRAGGDVAKKYPQEVTLKSNYALYAMYAGDFDTAKAQAEELLQDEQPYFKSYLPLAIYYLAQGDHESARQAYTDMAATGPRGAATARIGLADVALSAEQYPAAAHQLSEAITAEPQSNYLTATKYLMLARAQQSMQQMELAQASVDQALSISKSLAHQVPAALLLAELGNTDAAEQIAEPLANSLQSESRAYAELIRGKIALQQGRYSDALDLMTVSLSRVDLWLTRFLLAQVYIAAEAFPEAFSELEQCENRIGEATAIFLDDLPSFHYIAMLNQLKQNVERQLLVMARH